LWCSWAWATLTQGLLRHGVSPQLPVAIIERGFSDTQRTTIATLETVLAEAAQARVTSPAVLVIGDVVRLAFTGDESADALLARAGEFAAVD